MNVQETKFHIRENSRNAGRNTGTLGRSARWGAGRGRGVRMKSMLPAVLIAGVFITAVLAGCGRYTGPIDSEARDFYLDFKNTLFNSPEETLPADRGLGIDSVTITVTAENEAGEQVEYTKEITAADVDTSTGYDYSQVPVPIEGEIVNITAETADSDGNVALTAVLTEESGEWDYFGWTVFPNIDKVKIDFAVDPDTPESSLFRLLVCPRGGDSPDILFDSGEQATEGDTDRDGEVTTKQIALEIKFAEYPGDPTELENDEGDVTFDVYTAVAEENIAIVYNDAVNFEALYTTTPWTDSWTYKEITATGKTVGGELYELAKYNTAGQYNAVDPEGNEDGKKAFIIDLTGSEDENLTDKYLLVAVIMYYDGLAAPLDVLCIDIE